MGYEESKLENYLRLQVREKLNGRAVKLVSPGTAGMPDRLLLLPGGRAVFVECKAPGKKARTLQERRMQQLRQLGFMAEVTDTREKVDRLVELLGGRSDGVSAL